MSTADRAPWTSSFSQIAVAAPTDANRDQLHVMALRSQSPAQTVRCTTCLLPIKDVYMLAEKVMSCFCVNFYAIDIIVCLFLSAKTSLCYVRDRIDPFDQER
jgi:hypothetical protein